MLQGLEKAVKKARERRRLPRMDFDCPMIYQPVGDTTHAAARARFLSGCGLLFEALEPLEAGTRLEVYAKPPLPVSGPLWAVVTVLRGEQHPDDPEKYRIAAEIEEML